jgi:predicted nucleic acid-binding protein
MSASRAFVDTNVLVYAHDPSARGKHQRAKGLVTELWGSGDGCLSIQVLQEFYTILTRKVPQPLSSAEAARLIADLGQWQVHAPGLRAGLNAIERQQRFSISFWDAMALTSAVELGCAIFWSEDLNPGQVYDGVMVRNPFT